MFRRTFVGLLASLLTAVVGCGRRRQAEVREELRDEAIERQLRLRGYAYEPTLIDPIARVQRRLERAMTGDGVGFDPITLSLLASVICGVLRYCAERSATSIQRTVQRRPDGATAVRLRGKLRSHFAEAQRDQVMLFRDADEVTNHVEAAMSALITATPSEFQELLRDVQSAEQEPTVNYHAAKTASDWSRVE